MSGDNVRPVLPSGETKSSLDMLFFSRIHQVAAHKTQLSQFAKQTDFNVTRKC